MNLTTYNDLLANVGKQVYVYEPGFDYWMGYKNGNLLTPKPEITVFNGSGLEHNIIVQREKGKIISLFYTYGERLILYKNQKKERYCCIEDINNYSISITHDYLKRHLFIFTTKHEAQSFSREWNKKFEKEVRPILINSLYKEFLNQATKVRDKKLQSLKSVRKKISTLQSYNEFVTVDLISDIIESNIKTLLSREKAIKNKIHYLNKQINYCENNLRKRNSK